MQKQTEEKKFIDPVEKEDLLTAIRKLEDLQYLLGDIKEDFFNDNDIHTPRGQEKILIDFNRYYHYMEIAYDLLWEAVKEFHDNDVWCYERG